METPPLSPQPRTTRSTSRASSTRSTPRRQCSSSTEEGDSEEEAQTSPLLEDRSFASPPRSIAAVTASSAGSVGSTGSRGQRRKDPRRTNKAGLSLGDQKALAELVEGPIGGGLSDILSAKNGIKNFCEKVIANAANADEKEALEELLGSFNSTKRGQIKNKLYYWNKLEGNGYREVLLSFNIWPGDVRENNSSQDQRGQPQEPPSIVRVSKAKTKGSSTSSQTEEKMASQREQQSRIQVIGGVATGE